jgi:deoxyribose-phosphate aldolase
MLPLDVPETLRTATVVGFPSGKHHPLVKAAEARLAVSAGAVEIDMVIDIANALAGDANALISEIVAVREAVPHPVVLKVILESALLDEQQLRTACRAAKTAGADYVKTSTGFHPAGGASVAAVEIMADEVGGAPGAGGLGVKASGGIRDWDTAVAMIAAGATRLGVSAPAAILAGAPA